LTGGSAFGLEAAAGVVSYLERRGIGYATKAARVPIVPAAVVYDLAVGDPKVRPDAAMGEAACLEAERGEKVRTGNAGAGCGATVGKVNGLEGAMKGGLGTASAEPVAGVLVGAAVVVNAFGDIIDPAAGGIIAGARVPGAELDATAFADTMTVLRRRGGESLSFGPPPSNTVIAVVATNASLNKQEANILAKMAGAGITRTVRPAHTMVDGDTVFALSNGERQCDVSLLGAVAADVVGMAVLGAALAASGIEGIPSACDIAGEVRGMRVRTATPADADLIVELTSDLKGWFIPESAKQIRRDLERFDCLVAEVAGRIVGMLIHGPSVLHPEPNLVQVHWMAVALSHRGRGIGQALVRRIEEICGQRGGATLEVMTVSDVDYYPPYADTRAFYRAVGFEEFYVDADAKEKYGAEMLYFRKRIEGGQS
jgi:L-aminopeptidase/D-esterase-like protein/GNAT superfamily N-acetyltransferase